MFVIRLKSVVLITLIGKSKWTTEKFAPSILSKWYAIILIQYKIFITVMDW